MRKSIKQFLKICAETLSIYEPIYEFGSLQVPGQEGFADIRHFFPGKRYVGADIRQGQGVDIILDVTHIDIPSESIGTVLIMDTIEHVEFPRKAVEEVYRILKPNGILIMSSVMNFPIHDYPNDYWRFTPESFKSLINPFAFSFVEFAGESEFPHTVIGIGFKGLDPQNVIDISKVRIKLHRWKNYWRKPYEGGLKKILKLFAPPILLDVYRKIQYFLSCT